jgi:hypothetical protein
MEGTKPRMAGQIVSGVMVDMRRPIIQDQMDLARSCPAV